MNQLVLKELIMDEALWARRKIVQPKCTIYLKG